MTCWTWSLYSRLLGLAEPVRRLIAPREAVNQPFVDIHCHLLPAIDDGAADEPTALEMARTAVRDGIQTIICTPHQLGSFSTNRGPAIRRRVAKLRDRLAAEGIPLSILPGGDVRIEDTLLASLRSGDVLTLGDRGRHVLLELPHELYFPLEPLLAQLAAAGLVGILSHPERNQAILTRPALLRSLVKAGCLLQVTAGSLLGGFGPLAQSLAEDLLRQGLIHFLATDAHGTRSRRPVMRRAYERAAELAGEEVADQICCENPRRVAEGEDICQSTPASSKRRRGWAQLFSRRNAA